MLLVRYLYIFNYIIFFKRNIELLLFYVKYFLISPICIFFLFKKGNYGNCEFLFQAEYGLSDEQIAGKFFITVSFVF